MTTAKTIGAAAVIALAVLEAAEAACPNACSGHGQCGQYDACTCHVDWVGGDCSLRACPKSWAWVTTNANGDLNGDGDRNDLTVYDADNAFTQSGLEYVTTEQDPYGAWEQWPSFGNADGVDEGHFYMECANQGICDRSTGQCECFEGYTGAGCRRSSCPNDCNGHGVCQTVAQQKGTYAYDLWDKDMSRSCVCDAGYAGPDCSERKCGYGDDPLTTGQTTEKQWVDIYTDIDTTDWSDRTFSGHIRLKYTDYNGKQWTTDAIAIAPYATTNDNTIPDAVADALNSLPNDVLSGVTVTAGYAEHVITGNVNLAAATISSSSTSGYTIDPAGESLRCPASALNTIVYTADGTALVDYANNAPTMAVADPTTCYIVEHHWSIRLEISFPNQYGNLIALEVDTSDVTVGGLTDSQRLSGLVGSSVTSSRVLATHKVTGGITMAFTHPGDTSNSQVTCSSGNSCGVATKTVTLQTTNALKFPVNSRVKITCGTTLRGTFTVATNDGDASFTVAEDLAACDGTANDLTVKQESYYVTTDTDITGILSAGDVLAIDTFAGPTPTIMSINTWDATNQITYIFLSDAYTGSLSSGSETTTTAATDGVYQRGDATSEKEECSGRGLCDREVGICRCFKGYTGWACSLQNALSLGYGNE